MRKRQNSTGKPVVDLTEGDLNGTEQEKGNVVLGGCPLKVESVDVKQNTQDNNSQKDSSVDVVAPQLDCGNLKSFQRRLNSKVRRRQGHFRGYHKLVVKLPRLPFLETHIADLKTPKCYVSLTKDCTQMSLCFKQVDINRHEALPSINLSRTINTSKVPYMDPNMIGPEQQEDEFASTSLQDKKSLDPKSPASSYCSEKGSSAATSKDDSILEDERDEFCSSVPTPSPSFTSLTPHKVQKEVLCSNLEQLELNQADSRQSCLSDQSSPHTPSNRRNSSEVFDPDSLPDTKPVSHKFKSEDDPPPPSAHIPAETTPEWQLETEEYRDELRIDSPVSFLWQEGSDGEDMDAENRFGMDYRGVSREDAHFVCPVALRKIMSGPAQSLVRDLSPHSYICTFLFLLLYI